MIDVLRFLSVCSSLRSSISPKVDPFLLPMYLPYGGDYYRIRISRNTCYLVRLSHGDQTQAPTCWFLKIRDGTYCLKMQLLDPFSDCKTKQFPENFPKGFDLANFLAFELGHAYIGQFKADMGHPLVSIDRDYWTKVVWLQSCADGNDFMILTSFWCLAVMRFGEEWTLLENVKRVDDIISFNGKFMILTSFWCLAVMRFGEEWTLLENVKRVDDIISFNGKFYVVDREGRTIIIEQSLNIGFLGCVGRARKYLVKSVDDLLAVEMLHDTYEEDPITLWDEKVAGFKVFKMNEEEQKWEEMESLRDRFMFLSYYH